MSTTNNKGYPYYTETENPKFIDYRVKQGEAVIAIDKDIDALEKKVDGLGTLANKDSLSWDEIIGKPPSFTPETHTHPDYITANDVDAKIAAAIAAIPVYDGTVTEV